MELNTSPFVDYLNNKNNDMVDIDLNDNQRLSRKDKLSFLIKKYKINEIFSEKLDNLMDYETILLCDDSGSMNTKIKNKHFNTRWDELKYIINFLISLLTIYDNNGINIHFLNRGISKNIRYEEEAKYFLFNLPYGETPLTSKLLDIFYTYENSKKKVLIIIPTDGVPTNEGTIELISFKHILENMDHTKFIITFLICSDNNEDISYLKDLETIEGVNVLNNYIFESKEVRKIQGNNFNYSLEDHITRLILQPICEEISNFNIEKIKNKNNNNNNKCIIS
jgi:hypothetical protein